MILSLCVGGQRPAPVGCYIRAAAPPFGGYNGYRIEKFSESDSIAWCICCRPGPARRRPDPSRGGESSPGLLSDREHFRAQQSGFKRLIVTGCKLQHSSNAVAYFNRESAGVTNSHGLLNVNDGGVLYAALDSVSQDVELACVGPECGA